jgi:hypothetical protein
MVLVAATALGLALVQAYAPDLVGSRLERAEGRFVAWTTGPGSCLVLPWMLAILLLRLRQPHPPRRQLARQPGLVACAAAMAGLLPGALWSLSVARFRGPTWSRLPFPERWFGLIDFVAPAVVGAWLALALGGRWRAERGWIDRAGRALGVFWVATFLLLELHRLVEQFVDLF